MDRAGYVAYVNGGLFQGKIGAAVVAAGRAGATHAYDSINHMFFDVKDACTRFYLLEYWLRPRQRGAVQQDSFALDNMGQLGRAIDWLGKAVAPHMASYPAA